jgi:2-phosphoglycerate kinase
MKEVGMFYLIGGAPRVGKTILGQRVTAQLMIGWISTDLLEDLLRFMKVPGQKTAWNAAPEAIQADADWFFPVLERFLWGVNSMAESYVIEGVDFLPAHVARLAERFPVRSVFLGCSSMTLERFDRYPGRSRGYIGLPDETRRRFAGDIPRWSEFVRQEAARAGLPYVDTGGDFDARLREAEQLLTGDS